MYMFSFSKYCQTVFQIDSTILMLVGFKKQTKNAVCVHNLP